LAVCGDWCHGSRIEGAFLSGHAAAGYLLRDLALKHDQAATAQNLLQQQPAKWAHA
jgi:hypothetical protein